MNGYYNPNGQFGEWGQPTFSLYGQQPINFINPEHKKSDKKILRKIGFYSGLAILLYSVFAEIIGLIIRLLARVFPDILLLGYDTIGSSAFGILATVFLIGGPFFLIHFILKKKNISGNLPFGTTYNRKASISLVMFMFPIVIFSSVVINLISIIVQSMLGVSFRSGFEGETTYGAAEVLLSVVGTAIIPGLIEEIMIRGIIMQPLRRFGDGFAIVCSALIFSLMHSNMVQIPYTFVSGLYFGYIAIATGSLWPTIVLHFLNNFTSVLGIAYASNLSEAGYLIATAITYGTIIVIGIIGGIWYFKMRYRVRLAQGVKTLRPHEKAFAMFGNIPMVIAIMLLIISTISSVEIK